VALCYKRGTAMSDTDALPPLETTARRALPRFGIAPAAPLELIHHRENAVFRVEDPADGSRWAMRVHRPGYHTSDEIRSELRWMDALREAGVPTPRARPGTDGDPLQHVTPSGGDTPLQVDVLAWIEGRSLAAGGEDLEVHRLVGRTSALIQQHGRAWTPPPGFSRPVWDVDALIGPRALWGDYADLAVLAAAELALMHRAADCVRRRLGAFGRAPDRFGLTHGDLMPDNVLVADGMPHVIDFDDAGYGWYLYDLATLLADKVVDASFATVRDAWVEGYRTVASLPDEHLQQLDALVMARLLLGLGWMHTRRETAMARDFTAVVVHLACLQAEKLLGG
jgi:Ser/Thr protein kinase RdoA (MazF antagonist)